MSNNITPQLMPIEKNSETRRREVLTNIVHMLTNRGLIDGSKNDSLVSRLLKYDSDDHIYMIELDSVEHYYPDNADTKKFYIKLMPTQKVAGINKTSTIGEFLFNYRNNPKLVVVSSITAKGLYQAHHEHTYTEIFREEELMINIVEHISVPRHELLSDEDAVLLREEYGAKKRDLPKIFVTDPISRYYNAKVDQIFRIIRPSETAGQVCYYRLIIKGSVDN